MNKQPSLKVRQLARDIEPILWMRASQRMTVEYGELARALRIMRPAMYHNLHERHGYFHDALGIVSLRTLDERGFALTAIVVNKQTRKPSQQWNDLAVWAEHRGFTNLCGRIPYDLDWYEQQIKTFRYAERFGGWPMPRSA